VGFEQRSDLDGHAESECEVEDVAEAKRNVSPTTVPMMTVTAPTGDRTGEAFWVPLDPVSVQVDSDAAARAAGGTSYSRPEDVETAESDYVRDDLNAPADFDAPDNLALDHSGTCTSPEDPGTAGRTGRGDDIWTAEPPRGGVRTSQPSGPSGSPA
jgi:secreted PhoX family phosphatase